MSPLAAARTHTRSLSRKLLHASLCNTFDCCLCVGTWVVGCRDAGGAAPLTEAGRLRKGIAELKSQHAYFTQLLELQVFVFDFVRPTTNRLGKALPAADRPPDLPGAVSGQATRGRDGGGRPSRDAALGGSAAQRLDQAN